MKKFSKNTGKSDNTLRFRLFTEKYLHFENLFFKNIFSFQIFFLQDIFPESVFLKYVFHEKKVLKKCFPRRNICLFKMFSEKNSQKHCLIGKICLGKNISSWKMEKWKWIGKL